MSNARVKIEHGDIVDAIVECGYPIMGDGSCAGLTMKWVAAVLLGEEEEQEYVKRLSFINFHHKKWKLYRQKKDDTERIKYAGFAVVLMGHPEIKKARFYRDGVLLKSIKIKNAKKYQLINAINPELIEFIQASGDGKIVLGKKEKNDFLYSTKNIIKKLLKDADLPYSALMAGIDNARKKIIRKEKLSESERQFLNVPAFFDGVVFFQDPDEFTHIFGQKLHQSEINKIEPFASSMQAERNSGAKMLKLVYSKPRIFDLNKLRHYISDLEKLSGLENDQLVLSLGCINHRIGLRYHQRDNIWTIIDANELPPFKLEGSQLAQVIMAAFEESDVTAFNFNVYTTMSYPNQKNIELQLIELENKYPINDAELCNRATANGSTILHIAAKSGNSEIISSLAKYIDVDSKTPDGYSILHLAAEKGFADFIEELIKIKPDIDLNVINPSNKNHSLHYAAMHGYTNVVNLLLLHLVSPDVINKDGSTPLHLAATNGHLDIVKALLDKVNTIDIYKVNKDGRTPLHLAAKNGHLDIVKLILETANKTISKNNFEDEFISGIFKMDKLADNLAVFLLDRYGMSILKLAIEKNANKAVIKALLKNMDSNIIQKSIDDHGNTLMHFAANCDNASAIGSLFTSGVNLNTKNHDGKTCLDLALERNQLKVVQTILIIYRMKLKDEFNSIVDHVLHGRLLHNKLADLFLLQMQDINSVDENGNTHAHLAIQKGDFIYAINFIRMGVDLDIKNNNGVTIPQMAVTHYDAELINTLMQSKVDFSKNIESALDLAINNKNQTFLRYLFGQMDVRLFFEKNPNYVQRLFKKEMMDELKIIHQSGYNLFLHHQDELLSLSFNSVCDFLGAVGRHANKNELCKYINNYFVRNQENLPIIRQRLLELKQSKSHVFETFVNALSMVNQLNLFSSSDNDIRPGLKIYINTSKFFDVLSDYLQFRVLTFSQFIQFISTLEEMGIDKDSLWGSLKIKGVANIKSLLMRALTFENIKFSLNHIPELNFSLDELTVFAHELHPNDFSKILNHIVKHEGHNKTINKLAHFAVVNHDDTLFQLLITKWRINDPEWIQSIIPACDPSFSLMCLKKAAEVGHFEAIKLCLVKIGLNHVDYQPNKIKDEFILHYLDMHNMTVQLNNNKNTLIEDDVIGMIKSMQLKINYLKKVDGLTPFINLCDNLLNVYFEYKKLVVEISPNRMASICELVLNTCKACLLYMNNKESLTCLNILSQATKHICQEVSFNHKKEGTLSFTSSIPLNFFQDLKKPGGFLSSRLSTIIQEALDKNSEFSVNFKGMRS